MKGIRTTIITIICLMMMSWNVMAEEVHSPAITLVSVHKDNGEIELTISWDKTTLQAFEYSIVYDESKVTVKSAKLVGAFMSQYIGDGKNYSGLAIASDNGGYVALGGVVEAEDPTKIPQYEGAVATIVFAPKNSPATEDSNGDSTPPADSNNNQSVDMGDIKVVNGVSEYGSVEEIRQKAQTEPMAAFNLVQSADGEPIAANAAGIATGIGSGDDTEPQDVQAEAPSVAQDTDEAGEDLDASGSSVTAFEEEDVTSEGMSGDTTPSPTKVMNEPEEEKDSDGSIVVILVMAVCIMAAVIAVVLFKRKQDAKISKKSPGKTEDLDSMEDSK